MTQEAQAHPNLKIPRKTVQRILDDYRHCLANAASCIHHVCEDYKDCERFRECVTACLDDTICLQAISEKYNIPPWTIRELWAKYW